MILRKLHILNYKNISQADLDFSPKINCFLGNNGMGKTNLLDSIYYLSFCKSFSNLPDTQNISHQSDFFVIQGEYNIKGDKEEIYCGLKRRQKKHFKRNKKEYDKFSEHIGMIPLVMISPEDAELIHGGSEERRKFLDLVISQQNKSYLDLLIRYNKSLQQRNVLLKSENQPEDVLFDIWEEQMVELAELIYKERKLFIEEFIPVFQSYYKNISRGSELVELNYTSHLSEGGFREMLIESRKRDRILGYSTKGIHKDDLLMQLGDYPIRKIGSQGQSKTFLIALKFAQFDYLKKHILDKPLLLLDDIFDKLDSTRMEEIIKLVAGDEFGQIFITDTNREYLNEIIQKVGSDYSLYEVKQGDIILNQQANETT
ncbi:MAG: DNA replication/repair protein RecF [Bacteroidales bacterium]